MKIDLFIAIFLLVTVLNMPIAVFTSPVIEEITGFKETGGGGSLRTRALTPHEPIKINNDIDLSNVATSGTGTATDPYVIEGYDIDAHGGGYGICIANTTKHFLVRDVSLHNSTTSSLNWGDYGAGIALVNLSEGIVTHIESWGNLKGIYMENSDGNIIRWNNIHDNQGQGIRLRLSDKNIIESNTIVRHQFHGIFIAYSGDNIITENTFKDNNYGVDITDEPWNPGVNPGNEIENNTFEGGSKGICLSYTKGSLVEYNKIKNATAAAIVLSHGCRESTFVKNNMINAGVAIYGSRVGDWNTHRFIKNTINGEKLLYMKNEINKLIEEGYPEIILANCSKITIKNQNMGPGAMGILIGFSNNISVSENTFDGSMSGITLKYSRECSVGDNHLSRVGGIYFNKVGIMLENNNKCKISENKIEDTDYGIDISFSLNMELTGNIMKNSSLSIYGSYLQEWSTHTIPITNEVNGKPLVYLANKVGGVVDKKAGQIILINCSGVNVTSQNISGVQQSIILVYSTEINVFNNTIRDDRIGLYMKNVNKSIIFENNFHENLYDIDVFNTQNNVFYHNNFVDNRLHHVGALSLSDILNNQWDMGYPKGGNYWSHYNGTDRFHGVNQDIPCHDGIGDTLYALWSGADAGDHYPLMFPYETTLPVVEILTPHNGTWTNGTVKVEWIGEDDSGIDHYEVSVDKGLWENVGLNTSINLTLEDGPHTVTVAALDNARNRVEVNVTFFVDSIPPTINITHPINGEVVAGLRTEIEWTGNDTGAGIDHYELSIDGGGWKNVGLNTTYILILQERTYNITVRAVDRSLNTVEDNVIFSDDQHYPTIQITNPVNGTVLNTTNTEVVWRGGDMGSGVKYYMIKMDDSIWINVGNKTSKTYTNLSEGEHTVYVKVGDYAGYQNATSVTFYTFINPIAVLETSPEDGEESVSLGRVVVVIFSDEINPESLNYTLTPDPGGWSASWNENHTRLTLSHNPFSSNTTYIFSIKGGKSPEGRAVAPITISFKTLVSEEKGVVLGKILDENEKPIAGAQVKLDTGENTTTDENGNFSIEAPPGTRTVSVYVNGVKVKEFNVMVLPGEEKDTGGIKIPTEGEPGGGGKSPNEKPFPWIDVLLALIILAIIVGAGLYMRRGGVGTEEE